MADVLKISIVFVLTLLLLRRKLNIGYVMLISSCLIAVLYRMGPVRVLETSRKAAFNDITIKLLLALSLIRIFEIILREQNVLSSMMKSVKGFFKSKRVVIISMPMLIGMLPSLGGAYFSAPMVKEATEGLKMSQEEKAFINYWYRHPWEYVLPLYPGILLAAAISSVPLYRLIVHNMAYAAVLLSAGFIFSMRRIETADAAASDAPEETERRKKFEGLSFLPVASVLLLVVAARIELHYALLAVILPLILIYRYGPSEVVRITRHGFAADVIVLIFGIMLFKEMMEASGAVKNLSVFFVEKGIPVLPILCLLPFVTGLLTGHTVGFVGSTFPLLISIAGGAPVAAISFAFAAGFIGVLLSPVHLCLVLTREYFKADLWGVYSRIIPASLVIFCAALVEYLVLR
jgi:integral membrane protein (TIGR00529 family)